jgi:uncharacterized ferritin-like protein (DUF455 family)
MANDLYSAAHGCLMCADPSHKVQLTQRTAAAFAAGALSLDRNSVADPELIPVPGRPARPVLVHPRELAHRKLNTPGGRAALIHAVAHIEFNAINLAWDAVYRFRAMPPAYYADWVGVAADEARHFELLRARLDSLGHGYGDFDAHNGLWEMATRTAGSCLERMALVPRVLEARGLDVTPGMIERLRSAGDAETVEILRIILREEVAHVAAGSRWFAWCCEQAQVPAEATFIALVGRHAPGVLRPPFNLAARVDAGFGPEEIALLGAAAKRPSGASARDPIV